ncbi:AAA family ATPase [Kitasatospora sp. NPDC059646]|uniref:helix-turn-helix transcriptional regulator n=1 Tax=Kitasatospora sp. NPDC059646 TaxID=3346893 RepID=UPI0036AF9371
MTALGRRVATAAAADGQALVLRGRTRAGRSALPGRTTTTAGAESATAARAAEEAELAAFVAAADGRALVLRGGPGAGKSALLGQAGAAAERAGSTVVRAAGVEVESVLPYAGLHHLLHPLLGEVARLEEPARAVFDAVFGGRPVEPPSVLALGVAVLGLLARAAERRPLLLVLDDGHWLDGSSAEVCGFVGRRLAGGPVKLLVAVRADLPSRFDTAALPELPVAARQGADVVRLPTGRRPKPAALTWQEHRIAELAAGGLTNKEIGERMHLSPRTVGSHLYRAFPKLGVTTRAALRDALSRAEQLSAG